MLIILNYQVLNCLSYSNQSLSSQALEALPIHADAGVNVDFCLWGNDFTKTNGNANATTKAINASSFDGFAELFNETLGR